MNRKFGVSSLAALALGLALAGCAGMGAQPQSAAEIVKQRAQSRWNAMLAGDLETAYSFAAPSYRAVADLQRFRSRYGGGVSKTAVEVVSVDCGEKASLCTARIRMDFTAPLLLGREPAQIGKVESTHLDERWIMEEGTWWLYLEPGR